MPSLIDLPEIVGFFSYAREDDRRGHLSALCLAIQAELRRELERSETTLQLWQDTRGILPGSRWEAEIRDAANRAVFFIPIVTQRAIESTYCRFEFDSFLERERELGRADLVFPIVYEPMPALHDEARWRANPALFRVGERQFVEWDGLRRADVHAPALRRQIVRLCSTIAEALRRPWRRPTARATRKAARDRGLRIVGKDEVLRWGWDLHTAKLGSTLLALDLKWIRENEPGFQGARNSGTARQWANVFRERPQHWRLLIDGRNRIIGYWEIHLLFDEYYQKLKRGVLAEDELKVNMMPSDIASGDYPAYFSMIGIDKDYRKPGVQAMKVLIWSILDVFGALAKDGKFITEITARAWSGEGGALCHGLGMKIVLREDKSPNIKIDHWSAPTRRLLHCAGKSLDIEDEELNRLYRRHFLRRGHGATSAAAPRRSARPKRTARKASARRR